MTSIKIKSWVFIPLLLFCYSSIEISIAATRADQIKKISGTIHGAEIDNSKAEPTIEFMWSGGVTAASAQVKARVSEEGTVGRLIVLEFEDFSNSIISAPDTAIITINDRILTFDVKRLDPDSRYFYTIELNGIPGSLTGSFRTLPLDQASFSIAFASCASTGSSHPVFETIRSLDPLFFLHTGDFHYEDINSDNIELFYAAYRKVLASETQSALYRNVAIVYIWDDHDFGPNNSDSTARGKYIARQAYKDYVPSHRLVEKRTTAAIYRAFTVGRVRFIVCDSRSCRSPAWAPDNKLKTMLGVAQKKWLKNELINGRDNYALTVWVNSLPWIGKSGDDGWYLYTNERRELANFIKANQISNLCMLSGDAHMLAIDDGSNSGYADGGGGEFPVMHAASLDRSPSLKGGTYSHGAFPGSGQFGLMTVNDFGDSINVIWSGRNYLNEEIVGYQFSYPVELKLFDLNSFTLNQTQIPFELFSNYPNPFNQATSIEFRLKQPMFVTLEVYNLLGQKVNTLISDNMPPGSHRVTWTGLSDEGKALSTGIYFYKLSADGFQATAKMILLK